MQKTGTAIKLNQQQKNDFLNVSIKYDFKVNLVCLNVIVCYLTDYSAGCSA